MRKTLGECWALVTFETAAGCAAALRTPMFGPGGRGGATPVALRVTARARPDQ